MTIMLSKTYDALKAAGAPDDKAREAAEEIAGYENRLSGIEAELKLVKWMIGLAIGVILSVGLGITDLLITVLAS